MAPAELLAYVSNRRVMVKDLESAVRGIPGMTEEIFQKTYTYLVCSRKTVGGHVGSYRGRLVLDGTRDFSHMFNMNPAGGQEESDSTDESDSESW